MMPATLVTNDDGTLEAVLRRDRLVVAGAVGVIVALAWGYVLWLAADMDMGGMDMTGFRMIPAGMGIMAPANAPWRAIGSDPIEAKRAAEAEARVEAAKAITFGAAAKRFIKANRAGWKNSKHAAQWEMTLLGIDPNGKPAKTDYCKSFRDLPISAIDTTLVLRIIEPIWATKTETANRIRGRIETVIDAAKAKGEFKRENPARWKGHLDNLLPATSKVRKVINRPALPYRQLPAFMRELRARDGVAAAALEFQILTAVRQGNAVGAKWEQIDRHAAVWTIPAALMKSDAEHKVPLSDAAFAVLDRMEALKAGSDYVFPNSKGKPLSDASTAAVIDRMNEQERRWVDSKLDREIVPHGFRSSFRDWAAEHGYDDPVAEAALAHKVRDHVVAAYRRTDFFKLRQQMMKDWAEYCARPATSDDNVVPLRA
jgi:integrase